MEAVIFIGLQASGKSSFYKERYFSTHVRISLDLLKTRNRERQFLAACLETQQPFVIDNTNPSRDDRAKYIEAAKAAKYSIVGYYFRSKAELLVRKLFQLLLLASVSPIRPDSLSLLLRVACVRF